MNSRFFLALFITTAPSALYTHSAKACSPALPPVCAPLVKNGARIPTNVRGLFLRHEPRTAPQGGQTPASDLLPPANFYTVSGGASEIIFTLEKKGDDFGYIQSRPPTYFAAAPDADGAGLGAPGARTLSVPDCKQQPFEESSKSSFPITVTAAAPQPTSIAPVASTVRFSRAAAGTGGECGAPVERVRATINIKMPSDMLPWLDVVQWGHMPASGSRTSSVPEPNYFDGTVRVNADGTGVEVSREQACSVGAGSEAFALVARVPGVDFLQQPKTQELVVHFPDCASLPPVGSSTVETELGSAPANTQNDTGCSARQLASNDRTWLVALFGAIAISLGRRAVSANRRAP